MGLCMMLVFLFGLISKGFGDAVGVSDVNHEETQRSTGLHTIEFSHLHNSTQINSTRRPYVNPTPSVSKSRTTSTIHMCENSEVLKLETLDLIAIGPTIANMSKSCSCLITASKLNTGISIRILHGDRGSSCFKNRYDNATLVLTRIGGGHEVNSFQKDNLSNFSSNFYFVSAIRFSITLHSSCVSNYTIHLEGGTPFTTTFSQVQCHYTQVITAPLLSGSSTVAVTAGGDFLTASESTNSPRETYSQSSVQSTPVVSISNTGLIVGIVVGVGAGLILISTIAFCGYCAKHQRKTNANKNFPTRKSDDLDPERASSSETFECRRINSSTQAQSGTRVDYQNIEINPLALKTEENFYDVCGIDNNAFLQSNTLLDSHPITSDDDYEVINPRPSSSIDNDTTLIENDLYA